MIQETKKAGEVQKANYPSRKPANPYPKKPLPPTLAELAAKEKV